MQQLGRQRLRERVAIGHYLLAAFLTCLLGVGTLIGMTTRSAFQRERVRANAQLRSAAQLNVDYFASNNAVEILQGIANVPGLGSAGATACAAALEPLAAIKEHPNHIHVLRADGSEVCALRGNKVGAGPLPLGQWFKDAVASAEPLDQPPVIDPLTGEPAQTYSVHVPGPGQRLVVGVLPTGDPPPDVPPGSPHHMTVVEIDATTGLVLATKGPTTFKLGTNVKGTQLARRVPASGQIRGDADGVQRLYRELPVPDYNVRVIAALPKKDAFSEATAQLQKNLLVGATIVLLIAGLGLLLYRDLARPVRRLGQAIDRSKTGDGESAPAAMRGPAEVVQVAHAYNLLMEKRNGLEDDLRRRAMEDPLTGLPNRTAMTQALAADLQSANGGPPRATVFFLDLDRFKLINDSHGHPVGDKLLCAVAGRLRNAVPDHCSIARFGGDEFVLMTRLRNAREAESLARRIASVYAKPFVIEGHEMYLSGSVGIAMQRNGEGAAELIANADTAMYHAKAQNRGGSAIFDDAMRTQVINRHELERDLHRAIENDEFELHYQPKFAVDDQRVVGLEALTRWRHPERGLVSPMDFIPVAEDTGLIVPIGKHVLTTACRQAEQWRGDLGGRLPIAVNVAAYQLMYGNFPAIVSEVLHATSADPSELYIEVTESALMSDNVLAVDALAQLRSMGVKVSIDDFGTGYSSLAYLQQLPVDELKIDRSFVSPITSQRAAASIVGSIVDLAHAVGLPVVAEGVETAGQLRSLARMECDVAQGFYLARPQPSDNVSELLSQRGGKPVRAR